MTTMVQWDDEASNRTIQLQIDTPVDGSAPQVTPVAVEFTNTGRKIGVWTEAGRQLLRRQLSESGQLDAVMEQACETAGA